jgi:cyclopropane fatty-acyl-phospholipid synthase-like methyltransferase
MGLLDVGCGRGDLLFHLHARNPSLRLTGVDLAPLPDHSQIQFVTNDVFRWEPGCEFDVVASLAVIEHVEDVRGFMERIRRFARRGGRIIVTTLNEDSTVYAAGLGLRRLGMTGPFDRLYSRHHRQHFTRRSMQRLAEETGLRVVESFTHNFPVAAIDFPSRGPWLDAIQRAGVAALFGLGRLSGRCFLQTLVCEV